VLALTGPAGVGKTTTIRCVARDLGVEVLEWVEGAEEWGIGGEISQSESPLSVLSILGKHGSRLI
jgi:cell cycle checkpoint protein